MYKEIGLPQPQQTNCLIGHHSNVLLTAVEGMLSQKKRVMANLNKMTEDNTKVTVLTYGHFMRCEFVMQVVRDALAGLQANKRLYRHEIKQISRRINAEISRMNGMMYQLINVEDGRYVEGYDFVMDTFSEVIKPDYDKLYFSVFQAITNHTTEPQVYAAIEASGLISAMCDICIEANKRFFPLYSFINRIYAFNTSKLTTMLTLLANRLWPMVARTDDDAVIKFSDDTNIRRAVDVLKYKFTDGAIVVKSFNKLNETNNGNNCND